MQNYNDATHKNVEQKVEIIQEVGAGVINQRLRHTFVAEEFVRETFLHLKSHGAGFELCHGAAPEKWQILFV